MRWSFKRRESGRQSAASPVGPEQFIDIAKIAVPDRLRPLRDDTVAELTASFAAIGLVNPITVRPKKGGGYILIAGRQRLEAAKRSGWETIHCIVLHDIDADKAELIEIDENLMRAELSPAERAVHVGRRKTLYERSIPKRSTAATANRPKQNQVAKLAT